MYSSIVEAVKNNAKNTPNKICCCDNSGSITYFDYYKRICGIAEYLINQGIKKGDKVIVKTMQSINFTATLHAVQLIGAIVIPIEKNVKQERLMQISQVADAKVFITNKIVECIKVFLYEDINELYAEKEPCVLPNGQDNSTILFTTGTTGKSKGILMTHSADVAVAQNVVSGTQMKENNVEVIPMPLNHSFALRRYYANMINGSSTVFLDGVIFISKFFEAFDKYNATSVAVAPSAMEIIFKLGADKLENYKDKVDYIELGGSHLPEPEKEKLISTFPNSRLYNFYGSSEAGCSCILNFNSEDNKLYCIGKPTVNSDIRFVDEDGNFVEATEAKPAKLVTGGNFLMKEYYKEPELTAQTIVDGYVHSNDLGYKDEQGRVYMIGRADDVIISGGNKISPSDVEDACLEYEGVTECAVIAKEDKIMGQVPKLFVVVNDKYNESDMIQFLTQKLESFQVPKTVQIINAIPKTYNGKPLKRELQKM